MSVHESELGNIIPGDVIVISNMNPKSSQAVLFLAGGLLAAFFMPWFQLFGFGLSGYSLGRLGSYGNLAWIIPILAAAAMVRAPLPIAQQHNAGT